MNQLTFGALSAVAQVRRPTQRALAKQRTREKILAAGKALFTERGYEGATIRDIAAAAGMSTGAVFASFTDKSDLFTEIVGAEHEALFEAMDVAQGAAPDAPLQAMFDAAAERQMNDLPLAQATMCAMWSPGLGVQLVARMKRRSIRTLIIAALKSAVDRGQVGPKSDLTLIAQMLWDSYVAVLRLASLEGLGLEAVKQRVSDQAQIILAGSRQAQAA
ncbi:MAG: TetR/AcrR family transcriptional regulator [Caulobacterales bacterium]